MHCSSAELSLPGELHLLCVVDTSHTGSAVQQHVCYVSEELCTSHVCVVMYFDLMKSV